MRGHGRQVAGKCPAIQVGEALPDSITYHWPSCESVQEFGSPIELTAGVGHHASSGWTEVTTDVRSPGGSRQACEQRLGELFSGAGFTPKISALRMGRGKKNRSACLFGWEDSTCPIPGLVAPCPAFVAGRCRIQSHSRRERLLTEQRCSGSINGGVRLAQLQR